MSTPNFSLPMDQGATWNVTFNWYGGGIFRAPIEEVIIGYPTKIKVTGHLLPHTGSPTPVIISGIEGCPNLNSTDLGIEECTYEDDDHFLVPATTVNDTWVPGTGEITWHRPVEIFDWTAKMQIREKWHSKEIIHELTTENGGISLGEYDGSINLIISAAATELFTFNKAVYDIDMIDPNGLITRIIEGTITLNKEVTK